MRETIRTVAEVLVAARSSIADPADWLQGKMATKTQACAVGAVWRVVQRQFYALGMDRFAAAIALLHAALPAANQSGQRDLAMPTREPPVRSAGTTAKIAHLAHYNDAHCHADVLALYDRAIASAERSARQADAAAEPMRAV